MAKTARPDQAASPVAAPVELVDDDGLRHCTDGPAYVDDNGEQRWHRHGQLHREGGPAVTTATGSQSWFDNGRLHRVDGPAVTDGETRTWYVDGTRLAAWVDDPLTKLAEAGQLTELADVLRLFRPGQDEDGLRALIAGVTAAHTAP